MNVLKRRKKFLSKVPKLICDGLFPLFVRFPRSIAETSLKYKKIIGKIIGHFSDNLCI